MSPDDGRSARETWDELVVRHGETGEIALPRLRPPRGLVARPGRAQVTLDWDPVDGAAGYLVRRSTRRDGDYLPLEIGEPWVRAVPHPPLTDTTGEPGEEGWYTVAAVAAVDDHEQATSDPVAATPTSDGEATCRVTVDCKDVDGTLDRPWRDIIGSEHLSQLEYGPGPGGRHIGDEFAEALRLAHDELGVRKVRAHAILHDELDVYKEVDGQPVHDFTAIERIYDRVLGLGLKPVVELGFMPRDLAREPDRTVFEYGGIISPPKDWGRWQRLVVDLVRHLADRYGIEEIMEWGFEVWNEANLEVFWSGTKEEYLQLYEVTAEAVKSVDARLPVGGPASAAVGWIDDLLDHVTRSEVPIDFISTHTYGNAPLDLRPITARYGLEGLPIWWTEWGAHASHFNDVHDAVWSGAYLVRGMVSAMDRIDALAYWTISDHFEELGRPRSLLHGGFGLLSVGNLRKPRWWGLWMLEQLGESRVACRLEGDGAGDMVNAVATSDSGSIRIVVWNGTVDVSKASGDPLLDRRVEVVVDGLVTDRIRLRHRRLDELHSDIGAVWRSLSDGGAWPTEDMWARLREVNTLEDLHAPSTMSVDDGAVTLVFDCPMPAVSLIEIEPAAAL